MKLRINKFLLTIVSVFVVGMDTFAQDRITKGATALTNTKEQIVNYFDPLANIIYIVAAIVGLIGAIKVYSKFSSGDPDTGKTAASWFGAAIFIVVAVYALRAMFIN